MESIHDVFNSLIEHRSIEVKTFSFPAHENLRTRLVKYFSIHKNLLQDIGVDDGDSSLSMCADFDAHNGISRFFLQTRRTKHGLGRKEYTIVKRGLE